MQILTLMAGSVMTIVLLPEATSNFHSGNIFNTSLIVLKGIEISATKNIVNAPP